MSGYGIPHSSPLDTLVGKTSSRRPPNAIQIPPSHAASGGDSDPRNPYVPMLGTPPRRGPPQSPLLHTRFRTSVQPSHHSTPRLSRMVAPMHVRLPRPNLTTMMSVSTQLPRLLFRSMAASRAPFPQSWNLSLI
ncbi:hypothetical protein BC826DRAFT_98204 [Russula brevipes]|nr:hypothetical protein BC826DRAFT_98204 [Russula brevipes]